MHLNNKAIDLQSIEFAPIDYREENAHIESACYINGDILTDSELDYLEDNYSCELHALYMDRIY